MFDTNTLSALVHQRKGFEGAASRVDALEIEDRLVSSVTMSEIETMIAKAKDPLKKFVQVRVILTYFNIVDFGESAAFHAGAIRARLEPSGTAIGPLDTLIAAHARSLAAIVVTDNTSEFSRVPDLTIENWLR